MPFTDIAVAVQISLTYFTVFYLTGLGGLFSERSGIVNIGLEGLMIIGTVTGAFGVRFFTDTAGLAGSSGVSGRPLDTRISAAWTWLIRFGISEAWVGLLLR